MSGLLENISVFRRSWSPDAETESKFAVTALSFCRTIAPDTDHQTELFRKRAMTYQPLNNTPNGTRYTLRSLDALSIGIFYADVTLNVKKPTGTTYPKSVIRLRGHVTGSNNLFLSTCNYTQRGSRHVGTQCRMSIIILCRTLTPIVSSVILFFSNVNLGIACIFNDPRRSGPVRGERLPRNPMLATGAERIQGVFYLY